MRETTIYRWTGGELDVVAAGSPESASEPGRMLAADSWLVDEGAVRSLLLHYRRFQAAVNTQATAGSLPLWDFLTAVTRRLPRTGRWFPRIELLAVPEPNGVESRLLLQLRLRDAPAPVNSLRLISFDRVDPRAKPTIKGPDLSALMQVRRGALMRDADEAVLLTSNGYVLEGALSSIVWWDRETLCMPPADSRLYPSITRELLTVIAEATGVEIDYRWCRPSDLSGCEVWAVGSLHGISAASSWTDLDGRSIPLVVSPRRRMWQRRLEQMALPLPA